MTSTRTMTFVLGSVLLTTWLVSAAVTRRATEPLPASAPPTAANPAADAADDLQVQTARLRARLDTAPAPRRTPRNPFRFGARAERTEPASRRPAVVEAATVPDQPATSEPGSEMAPTLRLVGIAAENGPDGVVRTAALSVAGGIVLVRPGDEVAGRYRVTAVSADVVELSDRSGGPPLRLALR